MNIRGKENAKSTGMVFKNQCKCTKSGTAFLSGPKLLNERENNPPTRMKVSLMNSNARKEIEKRLLTFPGRPGWMLNRFRKQGLKMN